MEHRTIAVINQKGGVGKTTISTNLSHGLALKGFKVLVVDLDPQAQVTTSLGIDNEEYEGLDEALINKKPISDLVVKVRKNLDLLTAGCNLDEVERLTEGGISRGVMLRNVLAPEKNNYEYIIIDCPPSSGLLVVNAIFATQEVLIPMTGDFLALQGLSHLLATLKNFESALGHEIKKMIVLSKFHPRRCLSQEVKGRLIEYFSDNLLLTEINEAVVLAEGPSYGKSIFEYKTKSKSAMEYARLVGDVIHMRTH